MRLTTVCLIFHLAERFALVVDQEVLKDYERAFSVVRKMHTECRQSLSADQCTALLECKFK